MKFTVLSLASVYLSFFMYCFKWHTPHNFQSLKHSSSNGDTCAPTHVCFNSVVYTITHLCSLKFTSFPNKECRDCPLCPETSAIS